MKMDTFYMGITALLYINLKKIISFFQKTSLKYAKTQYLI